MHTPSAAFVAYKLPSVRILMVPDELKIIIPFRASKLLCTGCHSLEDPNAAGRCCS